MSVDKNKQQFISQRRVARKLALIAIYQWQMTQNSYQDIYLGLQEDKDLSTDIPKADMAYFQSLTKCAIEKTDDIDAELKPFLDREAKNLDQIERAVLRLACCEMLNHPESPYKVIVNESVNLTKKFGADQAHKFVNGVLDKLGQKLRAAETEQSEKTAKKSKPKTDKLAAYVKDKKPVKITKAEKTQKRTFKKPALKKSALKKETDKKSR